VKIMDGVNKVMAQSAAMGALPTLYAATFPAIRSGDYVGPDGFGEQRGHPRLVGMTSAARDTAVADRLWSVSEELTGVHYLDAKDATARGQHRRSDYLDFFGNT
jgi:hypothetical protein